ncbi:hypothetical protein RIF29_27551 [Crotalaria pallida]|uniref:Uncharacterized protein n=1 Tax=Crotalaria pallida TaxID=3830 RepID=A0AAN9EQ82_CROPI
MEMLNGNKMTSSMAGRSAITIVRTLSRASLKSTARKTPPFSFGVPLRSSNFAQNPVSTRWLLPRELSSFQPLHSAVASAYLVSKLPCESTTFTLGYHFSLLILLIKTCTLH